MTTGSELAEATREFLEREVMPVVDGRLRFLTRVAVNAIGQLERQLALGPELARAHSERLATLGLDDDRALCHAIRDGALDHRMDEVVAAVSGGVIDKLKVSNPRYLQPQHRST